MNDPHVVSLTYRIEKAETVDFDKAPPRTVDQGAFRVTIDAYTATIEMVDHFATVEEVRKVVQPFLRAWELEADLHSSADRFRFVFETAEVIDRSPPDEGTVVSLQAGDIVVVGMDAVGHVGRAKWPDPPQDLEVSLTQTRCGGGGGDTGRKTGSRCKQPPIGRSRCSRRRLD